MHVCQYLLNLSINVYICYVLYVGGYYRTTPGITVPEGQCDPGYFCSSGVNKPDPVAGDLHTGTGDICPMGHYCPINSTVTTRLGHTLKTQVCFIKTNVLPSLKFSYNKFLSIRSLKKKNAYGSFSLAVHFPQTSIQIK